MLNLTSSIEGKRVVYGEIRRSFEKEGFQLCSGWEYYAAHFDTILWQDGGVTMYLRIPAKVTQGKLDHGDARLQFGCPFVIKHVMNLGLDDDTSVLDMTGLSQFQKPLDPDDQIEREAKWRKEGEQALSRIMPYVL